MSTLPVNINTLTVDTNAPAKHFQAHRNAPSLFRLGAFLLHEICQMSDPDGIIHLMSRESLAMKLIRTAFYLPHQVGESDTKYFRYLRQLQNSWVPLPFLI